jgi:NAD+ kinase
MQARAPDAGAGGPARRLRAVQRLGLVVHPKRPIDHPLQVLRDWASQNDVEVVQLKAGNNDREVAPFGEVDGCDLVAAVGGDGTVLTALRAAAVHDTPVLGVACGSLGALAAVNADELPGALADYDSGSWRRRDVPALEITVDGEGGPWALNDFVAVRRAGQQLAVEVTIDDELYARTAGDGVVVATALGSSAYSMAAGGPLLVLSAESIVVTPLVVHGGNVPPLVVPPTHHLRIDVEPGFGGFDVEIDGQTTEIDGRRFELRLVPDKATLVGIGDPGLGLTPLRRRGLIADSPRMVARDKREQAKHDGG